MSTQPMVQVRQRSSAREGRMTALMRAVAPRDVERVLRVGVVVAGRVVEERVVKHRTSISVGQSERATFTIPGAPDLELFERVASGYALNFTPEMRGRVVCEDGVHDLAKLRARSEQVRGAYRLALTSESRGKVQIGEATFLFQFVEPPPPAARPQLPLSVKASLGGEIDWALTTVAAFSFMLHFGVIGAMYSDWSDQVVRDDVTVQGLADLLNKVPTPEAEDAPVDTSPSAPSPVAPTMTAAPRQATPSQRATQPGRMADHDAIALGNRAESMVVNLVGAMNSQTALAGVQRSSDAPINDLSSVAAAPVGASPGSELVMGRNSAIAQPGVRVALNEAGTTHLDGPGHVTRVEVAPPPGVAQIDPVVDPTARVPHADGTVAALRPAFRSCYNKGLQDDAHMSGKLVMAIVVQPNGDVQSVSKVDGAGLSSKVEQCILDKTRHASFEQGGGGTVRVPVSFFTQ